MVWLLRKFCSPKICKEVISGKKKKKSAFKSFGMLKKNEPQHEFSKGLGMIGQFQHIYQLAA
jgi:hypothetical protein